MGQGILCSRRSSVCTFCIVLLSKEQRCKLGCRLEAVSTIFDTTVNMGNMGSNIRVEREHENSYGYFIHHNKLHIIFNYFVTLFKEDMATIALGWKLIWTLGSLIISSSFMMALKIRLLNIDFGSAPMPFKITMYFLSCVVLTIACVKGTIACFHAVQRWRELKLKNDAFAKKNGLVKSKK
jgi:hypothetical protein